MQHPSELQFTVHGIPAPQGSKSFKGFTKNNRAILAESSLAVKPWREDVKLACIRAMNEATPRRWRVFSCVHVVIEFYLPRPKSQPKTRRTVPVTKPDLDKLIRAVGDSLTTAGVYVDDSCVADTTVRKRYVVQDDALGHAWELPGPGAVITVFSVDPASTWGDEPLDALVRRSLPRKQLPDVLATAQVAVGDAVPSDAVVISVGMTDSKALQAVQKAARSAPNNPAASSVDVVVEDGVTRCASYPHERRPVWVDELVKLTCDAQLRPVLLQGRLESTTAA